MSSSGPPNSANLNHGREHEAELKCYVGKANAGNRKRRARRRDQDLCPRQFRARRGIQKGDRDAGNGPFVVRADERVPCQRVVGCVRYAFVDCNVRRIGNILRVNRRDHESPRFSPIGGLVSLVC